MVDFKLLDDFTLPIMLNLSLFSNLVQLRMDEADGDNVKYQRAHEAWEKLLAAHTLIFEAGNILKDLD